LHDLVRSGVLLAGWLEPDNEDKKAAITKKLDSFD
jgi:hypothetical protein